MNLNQKVWIIQPLVHGNGGLHGSKLLSSKRGMKLKRALKINPYLVYGLQNEFEFYGTLGAITICSIPDINYSIYYFGEDEKWIEIN